MRVAKGRKGPPRSDPSVGKNSTGRNGAQREDVALSGPQMAAADALISGATDARAAEVAKVSRQTVWRWRTRDPYFRAELNRRRAETRRAVEDGVVALMAEAVERLRRAVREDEGDMGTRAALKLYDLAGLGAEYAARHVSGPTDAREVGRESIRERRAARYYAGGDRDEFGNKAITDEEADAEARRLREMAELEGLYGAGDNRG